MLDRTIPPKIHPIGNLVLPVPTTELLDNGATLRVLDSGTQDLNQLFLLWPGGMVEARTASVANLTGALLREGVKGMTGAEMSEALDFRGAIHRNEVAEHYSILAFASVNSLADGLFDLISRMVETPTFDEHALEIYKEKAVKTNLINNSKVATLSQQALQPMIQGSDNPLARVETPADIESITRSDIVDFHRSVYTASGCIALLGGRITDKIYGQVKDMLLAMQSSSPAMPLVKCPYHAEGPGEVFVEKAGALQNSVRIALPAPERKNPDYLPLRFAVTALGGYFGSRLMKNIREDKGYTYGIQAYLLGGIDGSYISISAQTDPAYQRPLIDETAKEMERMATEPLDADEMERVKQFVSMSIIDTLDSPLSVMDYYKTMRVAGFPPDYFTRQVELVHTITPEMIMAMAKKYFDPRQMRIAIAGVK
ncbi:MAG: insulinase family protein [Bacteroidales bacterium]|nr:insulinase family protein [Bacteroidales bacterium]